MRARIVIFLGIIALLNIYAGDRIIGRWPWADHHRTIAWLAVLGFYVLELLGPVGDRMLFPQLRHAGFRSLVRALDWMSYVAFGVMSIWVFYGLLTDIVGTIWQLMAPSADVAAFDQRMLLGLAVAVLVTTVIGIFQAQTGPLVRRVEIALRNLPAAFDGFKIAQISDVHIGPTLGRAYMQKIVDITGKLGVDLIALTGDFADGTAAELADDMVPVSQLKAPHGVYFVTGNHEYYWNAASWTALYEKLGVRVLNNEHEIITRAGDAIVLAGVTDLATTGAVSSPSKAFKGAPGDLVKILLAHQPASCHAAQEAGFDLQLSGHTHGGQYFPFSLLIGFFQRYAKGLNRHKDMWVYVSCGTGYWGPPLRTGVPSEIIEITLRPA